MRYLAALAVLATAAGCSISPQTAGLENAPVDQQKPPLKDRLNTGHVTPDGWATNGSIYVSDNDAGPVDTTPDAGPATTPPDAGPIIDAGSGDDAGTVVDAGTPPVVSYGSLAFGTPWVVSTGVSTWAISHADMNNDGLDDVVKVGWAAPNGFSDGTVIVSGASDGGLVPSSAGISEPGAIYDAVGDINGDGWLDFVATGNGGVDMQLSQGDGTFAGTTIDAAPDLWATYKSQIADLDGDGRPDIVTAASSGIYIFFDDGDGSFGQPVSVTNAECDLVLTVDIDGDGTPDLLSLENYTDLVVRLAIGDGGFSSATTYSAIYSGLEPELAVRDFNGDSLPDVVWGNGTGLAMRLNTGGGALGDEVDFTTSPATGYSSQLTVADLNGDGLLDVATAGGPDCDWDAGGGAWVFLNDGDGGFTTGTPLATDPNVVIRGITAWLPAGALLPSLIVGDFCDGNMTVFPNLTADAG
jgi:hypothetical protein